MRRGLILTFALIAVALAAASCHMPCGEPFWKKAKACEESGPAQ